MNEMVFNPKVHICKFGYEYYGFGILENGYSITGDLYHKELRFDFWRPQIDGSKKIIDTVGFKLSDKTVNELLALLEVEKYEKFRDLPFGWQDEYGYRDGWGYNFWYISEYGTPLFQLHIYGLFPPKKLPPHEALLKWICDNYKGKKQLREREILW